MTRPNPPLRSGPSVGQIEGPTWFGSSGTVITAVERITFLKKRVP